MSDVQINAITIARKILDADDPSISNDELAVLRQAAGGREYTSILVLANMCIRNCIRKIGLFSPYSPSFSEDQGQWGALALA